MCSRFLQSAHNCLQTKYVLWNMCLLMCEWSMGDWLVTVSFRVLTRAITVFELRPRHLVDIPTFRREIPPPSSRQRMWDEGRKFNMIITEHKGLVSDLFNDVPFTWILVFRVFTQTSKFIVSRHFEGTYRFHLQRLLGNEIGTFFRNVGSQWRLESSALTLRKPKML